ncbi:MAG TPA: NADH-quinone oxidoreductase subunit J [candidate division Zixibacteria bacterium]|nr:NADH-quinone oxidoreductase subunit J [candidate division Zixibacteria bacterium]
MEMFQTVLNELSARPVFWLLSFMMLISGFMVVTLKNIFHSAIYLILCLFSVAGLFILLQAEFLAAAQVLIYVGAVAILMIFAIMLSTNVSGKKTMTTQNGLSVSLISAVFALGTISLVIMTKLNVVIKNPEGVITKGLWIGDKGQLPVDNIFLIGKYIMTEYMLPFEVVSVLLLASMIGAIVLARKERS